jgi:nucleoside-diphosphate-sugar epimerase
MRILLAGASGELGRRAVRELVGAGHSVTGLGRGAGNALRADLLDREAVLRAVDGLAFDAVVHAATALRGKQMAFHRDLAATDRLRLLGTPHLLDAARATGARRFVVESMVFGYGYGDLGDRPLEEDRDPFGPPQRGRALERHVAAMRAKEELAFTADGIEGVSLRFGLFYGAGVTESTVLRAARRRALPAVDDQGRALAWVDVDDAARAVALAVEHGRPGAAYNIADDTPTGFGAHVRAVAAAFGVPRPFTVPLWFLRHAPLAYAVMSANVRLSNAKARADLGWAPTWPGCVERLAALAGTPEGAAA